MRILKHLAVISVLLSLCISCAEDILPIAVEGLELNLTTISMKVGESKTLTVTITPADAENQTVKWSSTNKAVASVEDGEITAHKAGETTISVTSEDGGFRASCTVTVTEEQNPDDGNNNDSGNEDDGNEDDGNGDGGNNDGNDDGQTGEDDGTEIKVGTATLTLDDITATTVTFTGSASAVSPDFEVGIYYSLNPKVQVQTAEKVSTYNLNDSNGFTLHLSNLQFDATYYYCVFVHMNGTDVYSDTKSFKTGKVVAEIGKVDVQMMNAVFSGTLERSSQDASVAAYVEYGTDPQFATGTIKQVLSPAQDGKWTFTVTGLPIAPTEYYYRTYIYQQSHGKREYGETKSFTTVQADISMNAQPVTQTTATFAGTVKSPDNSTFEFGVLYSTGSNLHPQASEVNKQIITIGEDGSYSVKVEKLQYGTKYNYRWYTYRDGEYNYGESMSFSTQTISVEVGLDAVTQTTATFSGIAVLTEPESIDEVGILYSTTSSFTAATSGAMKDVFSPDDAGNYTSVVEDLIFDTKYYYRTFVLQDGRYVYGEIVEFKTQNVNVSLKLKNVTTTTATFNGMVTLTEKDVIEIGIMYSKDNNFLDYPSSVTRLQCANINMSDDVTLTADNLGGQYFRQTYYYCHYIKQGNRKEVFGDVTNFTTSANTDWTSLEDISMSESANCYIISKSGPYKIKAVKGNSSTSVGSVASADILWESFGTATAPTTGQLVNVAEYRDGFIGFQVPDAYREGNAVIAAKDANGKILWSWHIWLTDQPQEHVYPNDAGTMMDRNLGATSAIAGDVGALGLLYQWGRKDPFLGSSSISSAEDAKSTITWPSPVLSNTSTGTIEYSVANPTTFVSQNYNNADWYYTETKSTDNTRWTESNKTKSIYDPCPAGWRVPDGGDNGVWNKAGFAHPTYDESNEGISFSISSPSTTWYPATGSRGTKGGLETVGVYVNCWSCSPEDSKSRYAHYAHCLNYYSEVFQPTCSAMRAKCISVRCIKE